MATACLLLGPFRNWKLTAARLIWGRSQRPVQVDRTRKWLRNIMSRTSDLFSPSSSIMSRTTPRTLLTTSGRPAEPSAEAALTTGCWETCKDSVTWEISESPGCRTVSRAVEGDNGERRAEHSSPQTFTSDNCKRHPKTQCKDKTPQDKEQYTVCPSNRERNDRRRLERQQPSFCAALKIQLHVLVFTTL